MSHTSQRRGLDPGRPGEEIIVLAMVPSRYEDVKVIKSAMAELAMKMLEHEPDYWMSKNFTEIRVPQLGPAQGAVEWLHDMRPEATERLLMRGVAYLSTVVTAIYTDVKKVEALLNDIKGEWLENNRKQGLPVSIVLSGLFDDIQRVCGRTGLKQHTYLQTIGAFGRTERLPSKPRMELVTMCGHGLISQNRVEDLARRVSKGEMTPRQAAENITRPCVCGIVNRDRAERIFKKTS